MLTLILKSLGTIHKHKHFVLYLLGYSSLPTLSKVSQGNTVLRLLSLASFIFSVTPLTFLLGFTHYLLIPPTPEMYEQEM